MVLHSTENEVNTSWLKRLIKEAKWDGEYLEKDDAKLVYIAFLPYIQATF